MENAPIMAKIKSELQKNMLLTVGQLALVGFICYKQHKSNYTWIDIHKLMDGARKLKFWYFENKF